MVIYVIRRLLNDNLKGALLIVGAIVTVWYFILNPPFGFNIYGNTYFKWGHYFLFMLLGASLGISKRTWKFSFAKDGLKLIGCIMVYYGMLIVCRKVETLQHLELLSLLPLLGITFYMYKLCNTETMKKLYYNRYIETVIKFVGGLCLEIYLVQYALFTDKMNNLFPLNLLLMMLIIVAVAYLLRCLARIFTQTFRAEDYNWREVFRPY